jgi:hypothetical protein
MGAEADTDTGAADTGAADTAVDTAVVVVSDFLVCFVVDMFLLYNTIYSFI